MKTKVRIVGGPHAGQIIETDNPETGHTFQLAVYPKEAPPLELTPMDPTKQTLQQQTYWLTSFSMYLRDSRWDMRWFATDKAPDELTHGWILDQLWVGYQEATK